MGKPMFTPEELEELRRIDAEIDKNFFVTPKKHRAMDPESARLARNARQKAYNQARREKILEYQRAYNQAHREEILAKARERNARKRKSGGYTE